MQELFTYLNFFSRSFSMPCASFLVFDGPDGTGGKSSIENDEHGIEKLLLKKLK
jgi:hypothetical protein